MTKQQFLRHFEEVLEAGACSMNEEQALSDLDGWDSLAKMSFIAILDEHFSVTIPPEKIGEANTIKDLILLLGDEITD